MTMRNYLVLSLLVLLASCGGGDDRSEPVAAPATLSWGDFAANTIADYYAANPEIAVYAGLHEYDGQMSDNSLAGAEKYAEWIDTVVAEAESYDGLQGIEAFERDYLVQALRGEQFWIRDSGFLTNNPVVYSFSLGMGTYIDREYAPLDERIVAYTDYVSELPAWLLTMQENLQPPLPAPYVETAHGIFSGMADYFRNTVPGALR